MSDKVTLEYTCRRCGLDFGASSMSRATAEDVLMSLTGAFGPGAVPRTRLHRCYDGGAGLSDLIGYGGDEGVSSD